MKQKDVCAGIVTYEPDIGRLRENIDAVIGQVREIYVVDNGSKNRKEIEGLLKDYDGISLIRNKRNEGIAKALNQIIGEADRRGYRRVITLDQDSVCCEGLIEKYLKYEEDDIGILICDIEDRNYKLRKKRTGTHSAKTALAKTGTLPAKTETGSANNDLEWEEVEKCITSGAFTSVKACIEAGGFDEKLFIDSVDYDMCYSMREHGYRIVNIHFTGLLHEVGKSVKYNILGYEFAVNHHSAERKYYISRNSTYLIKKHHLAPLPEYTLIFRRIFTVLFFERDKRSKIKAIMTGVRDGWKMQKTM